MARCAICGRQTNPAVFIGAEAIGPTCARKAGLTKAKMPKGSRLRFVVAGPREKGPQTGDLFPDLLPGGGR